jgi:hypothetical protein
MTASYHSFPLLHRADDDGRQRSSWRSHFLSRVGQSVVVGQQWLTRPPPGADFAESVNTARSPLAVAVACVAPEPPHLVIEQTHRRGRNPPRRVGRFVFPLRNDGPGPLVIAAKTGCGCTVVHHDKEISAGGRSELVAELNTGKLQGLVTKSIDVQTNDPARPKLHLELAACIVSAVEVFPASDPVFALRMAGPTVHELQLRAAAGEPVEVTGVQCREPYVAAALEPTGEQAGRRTYRLALTFGPEAPPGKSDVHITLTTTAKLNCRSRPRLAARKGLSSRRQACRFFRRAGESVSALSMLISKREGTLY